MANPRQRRKARNSSHRPVSHSRHAQRNLKKTPPIRGPKVLQDAWDSRKTVRQNYAALGLVNNLNPLASGGVERVEDFSRQSEETPMDLTGATSATSASYQNEASSSSAALAADSTPAKAPSIPKGYGKILRDEAGNVIGVELAEDEGDDQDGADNEENGDVDMEMLEPQVPQKILGKWVTELGGGDKSIAGGSVVQALQRISTTNNLNSNTLSASITGVGARHSSTGERAYLQRLVDKYGLGESGIEAMAKDRKLNAQQRTKGELTRALKRSGFA